jgi:hypothetical protein
MTSKGLGEMFEGDSAECVPENFQPQLQVKLSLKAELALISDNPATHPQP